MKRTLSCFLALALALACVPALSGCGKQDAVTLRVYCEGNLIRQSLMDDFSKETGIVVEYITGNSTPAGRTDTLAGVDEAVDASGEQTGEAARSEDAAEWSATDLYDQLAQRQLDYDAARAAAEDAGGDPDEVVLEDAPYDVVFTSGDTIGRLIEGGLVQKLDSSLIPNAANIDEEYRDCSYDPGAVYSVTTLWQTKGLLWNTRYLDANVTSWSALWDEAYRGRLLMPGSLQDAMAVALISLGYSVNTEDADEISEAWEALSRQAPLVQAYTQAEGFSKMTEGETWLSPAYSGDALTMMSENPDLSFVLPSEGTWRSSYGYCIPEGTAHLEEACAFIDYMCRVDNLAKNAIHCKYSVTSSKALSKMDSSWRNNPLAYPDESLVGETELLSHMSGEIWDAYAAQWEALTGNRNE